MKMEEQFCGKLIDNIIDELFPQLDGWGSYEFEEWYTEPAGFCLVLSGDWKHMHKRADNIVKELAKKNGFFIKVDETEIGHSDCDWYRAYHQYLFRKTEPKKTKAELEEEAWLKEIATNILGN